MGVGGVRLARPDQCLPGWMVLRWRLVCWRSGRFARCGMKRPKISHLSGAAAAAVSALVLLTPGVAAAQAWTVVPSPSAGQLNGAATVSANDVWAVGQTLAPGTLAPPCAATAWSGI